MARRSRKPNQQPTTTAEASPVAEESVAEPTTAEASTRTVRKVMLTVILAVFALFMVTVVALFQSGESIRWKKELTVIDAQFARGEKQQAAVALEQFGERWPDAKNTVPWNEKAARYFSESGDWKKAAFYYAAAVELDRALIKNRKAISETPGIRARAGEALCKSGEKEKAVPFLKAEIEEISRAVGDHDRAHFHLGLIAAEADSYAEALAHFQAIANPEPWKTEIARVYSDLDTKIIEPSRETAREKTLQDVLSIKSENPRKS